MTPAGGRRRGPRYGRWRRAVQANFALLFLALPFAGSTLVAGSAVALRVGRVDLLEPTSALSGWLASRVITGAALAAALPLALLVAGLGSVYCGWICPFGFLSEGLDRLRGRARSGLAARRARPPGWSGEPWRRARLPRLAALAAVLLLSAGLAVPLAGALAPPRLLTVLPLEVKILGAVPPVTATLLAAWLALELVGPRRLTCRALCPVGGLSALLRAPVAWRPRFDAARCLCPGVPGCLTACAWGIDPRRAAGIDGCTSCLACLERCPSGALTARRPTSR